MLVGLARRKKGERLRQRPGIATHLAQVFLGDGARDRTALAPHPRRLVMLPAFVFRASLDRFGRRLAGREQSAVDASDGGIDFTRRAAGETVDDQAAVAVAERKRRGVVIMRGASNEIVAAVRTNPAASES